MDNLSLTRGGNFNLNSSVLEAGTTAGTVQTGATSNFVVDGQFYSKAATNNIAVSAPIGQGSFVSGIADAGSFQAHVANKVAMYGVWLDVAGNAYLTQGPLASVSDLANGVVSLQWAEAPRVYPDAQVGGIAGAVPKVACIGQIRVAVQAAGGGVFVPGTTAWATAGNFTVTFYQLFSVPGDPIRS
jgi:hypothetical protein